MAAHTCYEHIYLNDLNVPVVVGTTMKVVELVLDHLTYGWSAEEIHFQHPTVSMAQVHAALAYYWDHKSDIDEDIRRRLALVDALQASTPLSPFVKRVRTAKPA